MTEPKVSFVVTSYNHKKFLKEAIDSILNQSYKNIEIIVVDDCSTDGSIELLLEYEKKHRNLKAIIHNYRWGRDKLGDAIKEGVNNAGGKYVCIMMGDDLLLKDFTKKSVEVMEAKNAVLSITDYYLIDENGNIIDEIELKKNQNIDVLENKNMLLLKEILTFRFYPPGSFLFFRCDVIKKIEFPDESRFLTDLMIFAQAVKFGEFAYINEKLACFRRHSKQATASSLNAWEVYIKKISNHYNYYRNELISQLDEEIFKNWKVKKEELLKLQLRGFKKIKKLKHYSIAFGAFLNNDFKTSTKHFFLFFLNPLNIKLPIQYLRAPLLLIDSILNTRFFYRISKRIGQILKWL